MEQDGARPAASWVLGRSARWHTAEGSAMLAEDGVAEDLHREALRLRAISTRAFTDPSSPGTLLWLLGSLFSIAWRTFRPRDDQPLSWPSCGSASSGRPPRRRRRPGG